jgi:hypothetical protein
MQPAVGVFLEASAQQPHHTRWSVGWQGAPIGLVREDGGQRVLGRLAAEGLSPGQRLVEDAATLQADLRLWAGAVVGEFYICYPPATSIHVGSRRVVCGRRSPKEVL